MTATADRKPTPDPFDVMRHIYSARAAAVPLPADEDDIPF